MNEVGFAVECRFCGLRKAPRGRSVPIALANSLCCWECPGYNEFPEPGELWPGETRAEFEGRETK